MKAPRTVIYLICLYCLISAVVFMALATLSILSYACVIDFSGGPVRYMMFLMYFRDPSCDPEPNWGLIGVSVGRVTPDLPLAQTAAVLKTFVLSIIYLSLNFFLFLTIFRTLSGMSQRNNKHKIFWSYFSPLLIAFIVIIILDFIAAAIYIVDFFLLWLNSDKVMDLLEIINRELVKEEIANIAKNTRSLPSMIMFLATSKVLLLLTFNCALVYVYFVAAWKVCRENQKVVLKITSLKKSKKNQNKSPQPVEGSAIHRIESVSSPATNGSKVKTVKKSEMVVKQKEKKQTSNEATRDETELPSMYQVETPTVAAEPKTTTVNKVEKFKKEKNIKSVNHASRDVTELPEVIPRINYQNHPLREDIPLPAPPSFKNKHNHDTKF